MKVKRVYEKEVKEFKVGDQIQVGKYTATAVKKQKNGSMLFLLDQYLDKTYGHTNLIEKMNANLEKDPNFKELIQSGQMDHIWMDKSYLFRIPYAGEIFNGTSEDEWVRIYYEPDIDDDFFPVFECMKDRRNRIATVKSERCSSGWLMNKVKTSVGYFAIVNGYGYAIFYNASNTGIGVRPVFLLNSSKLLRL